MGNLDSFTFYGFREGCSYCGKPLGSKYSFCPFTEPMICGCDRPECKQAIIEKKKRCSEISEEVQALTKKIIELGKEQKSLGFLTHQDYSFELIREIDKD